MKEYENRYQSASGQERNEPAGDVRHPRFVTDRLNCCASNRRLQTRERHAHNGYFNDICSIDIAVNTVGKVLKKPVVETTEAEYDSMFAINSKAAYFFVQEAGKRMNDGGRIVTIVTSLLAAFTGLYSTYAGSKAPVEHFTRAAAKEFGPRGISVNNVGPGPMDTPFFYPAESPDSIEYHKSASMNGKLTDINDIAPIVRFLVTEGWWITGQTIFANGGYTTR